MQSFSCLSFLLLAFFVLIHFLKRLKSLFLQRRYFHEHQHHKHNFDVTNHLKNLSIKLLITNFIILILIIEILNNFSSLIIYILLCIEYFKASHLKIYSESSHLKIYRIANEIGFITYFCYLPTLCLIMNVIWLVYMHSPYKYVIARWSLYIVLRLVAISIIQNWQLMEYATQDEELYKGMYKMLYFFLRAVMEIIDLITYVVYSKRLVSHLKGRELEAKLFEDKMKYLENKYVRVHFTFTTILVTIAFLIHTLGDTNFILYLASSIFTTNNNMKHIELVPMMGFHISYRIVLNLNYFYIIFVFVAIQWRRKLQLDNINKYIHPIVRRYQQTLVTI